MLQKVKLPEISNMLVKSEKLFLMTFGPKPLLNININIKILTIDLFQVNVLFGNGVWTVDHICWLFEWSYLQILLLILSEFKLNSITTVIFENLGFSDDFKENRS